MYFERDFALTGGSCKRSSNKSTPMSPNKMSVRCRARVKPPDLLHSLTLLNAETSK
jgi:hypothetical protein